MPNDTTSTSTHFWDILLELRLPIYRECLPPALQVDQQLPPITYEGIHLIQPANPTNLDSYKLLFNPAMRPLLNLTPREVLKAEFKELIKSSAGKQHIFKISRVSIHNLAICNSPHPIQDYHNIVFDVDNELSIDSPITKQAVKTFMAKFQNANHVHVYISSPERHVTRHSLFYEVKDVLKQLPRIKTFIICNEIDIGSAPHKQYGWRKSHDGGLRLFDPRIRGVDATGTMGTLVLVQMPVPNFIAAGACWNGTR